MASLEVWLVEIWLVYVATILVLMSTPGPSHILILSNSISSGFKRSLFTGAGDLSANFLQMVLASLGLVTIIANSQDFFTYVKWLGVAYLVYLGLRLIFSSKGVATNQGMAERKVRSRHSLYWQGFITSAANPKAVVFFAALFPQFIDPKSNLMVQFLVLSSTYLVIDGIFLCFYAKFAQWLSLRFSSKKGFHLNRVSGGFLIMAAILLGLKEIDSEAK